MTAEGVDTTRLRVGIIGSGRVGCVLGAALRRVGHHIIAVSGRSDLSRVRAEALLPGVPMVSPDELARECELLIIAVPDDAIGGVVADIQDSLRMGQYVMHVSGRHGLEILDPVRQCGAVPLAIHPVMTFTGTSVDLDRLDNCPFAVTADPLAAPVASALVIEMGGDPVPVDEGSRVLYHAALAHGANHLITLVSQTLELLRMAGVTQAEKLSAPLLQAALDNALRSGDGALTGPLARGDVATVTDHLDALWADAPEIAPTYLALARATTDRALGEGLVDASAHARLVAALIEISDDPAMLGDGA
jgi:predicted short-subunit dehydrogenase-like oxidoreductase (DUF2520 family)